jgi:U4/U6 small nuclear ribonucleoprotein PRP31
VLIIYGLAHTHTTSTSYLDILINHISTMATLADELLNDFDDSGSEVDEQNQNGFLEDDGHNKKDDAHRNGGASSTLGMELDEDGEDMSDAEKELVTQNNATALGDAPDEEETKARVEKMKLGGVSDVRSVAGLMKTLQPVLEVRLLFFLLLPPLLPRVRDNRVYISIVQQA